MQKQFPEQQIIVCVLLVYVGIMWCYAGYADHSNEIVKPCQHQNVQTHEESEKFLAGLPTPILELLFTESILTPSYYDAATKTWERISLQQLPHILDARRQGEIANICYINGVGHGANLTVLECQNYYFVGYGIPVAEDPTRGGVIIFYKPEATIWQHHKFDGRVTALQVFQERLWVGTNAGVYQFSLDFQHATVYDESKGLPTGNIITVLASDDESLWCGMGEIETWDMDDPQSGGAGKYDSEHDTWSFYNDRQGKLPGKWVSNIQIARDGISIQTESGWTIFHDRETSESNPPVQPEQFPLRSQPLHVSDGQAQQAFYLQENWSPLSHTKNKFDNRGNVVVDYECNLFNITAKTPENKEI